MPPWARRYVATDFPAIGVAADVVACRIAAAEPARLELLLVRRTEEPFAGLEALPGGFLAWNEDDDLRATALRTLRQKGGVGVPRVLEALATYSANGRDPRQFCAPGKGARIVSEGYLALLGQDDAPTVADGARWVAVEELLPWEERRTADGRAAAERLLRELRRRVNAAGTSTARSVQLGAIDTLFGAAEWNEERAGERFALLREHGLVTEAARNGWGELPAAAPEAGYPLAFDHRQMVADALGRLRGKQKYLPLVLAALVPDSFPLRHLVATLEAVGGRTLHAANFRRIVTQTKDFTLLEALKQREATGRRGPQATLFRFEPGALGGRLDPSIRLPWVEGGEE
jgi:hypothetical protein